MTLALDEIASWLLLPAEKPILLTGVSINSRTVEPGELFVAVRGERFDGHDFIREAVERGAVAVLCSRPEPAVNVPQLVMPCTASALGMIATHHRRRLGCQVIALTGSNGKTTVKEMIAQILPQPSFATPGNLNNHLGVPLSLLRLKATHRYGVFELGANHIGEIAHTVAMVQPHVTLINNVAPAHLSGFGSIEGVARAKGEIHQGLLPGGTAVVNADDPSMHAWDATLEGHQVVYCSVKEPRTVYADEIVLNGLHETRFTLVTPEGRAPVVLRVPGLHNVSNAVAAAACTRALGVCLTDIASGLNQFGGVSGRLTYRFGKNQSKIIDDTYNANLRSVLAGLDVLASVSGQRILILGDLAELGDFSEAHHQEIGRAACRLDIDAVFTCGVASQMASRELGQKGRHYHTVDDLLSDVLPLLDEQTTVLVKGSRSSAMERVVRQLEK